MFLFRPTLVRNDLFSMRFIRMHATRPAIYIVMSARMKIAKSKHFCSPIN